MIRFAIIVTFSLLAILTPAVAQSPPSLPDGTTFSGHAVAGGGQIPPPTLGGGACGSPVLTPGSTDMAGQFQAKGIACAIVFGKPFASQPFCIVQDITTPADSIYTFGTSGTQTIGIVITTTVINDFVSWICFGRQGN